MRRESLTEYKRQEESMRKWVKVFNKINIEKYPLEFVIQGRCDIDKNNFN